MNEIIFDIKNFSYTTDEELDLSFIPMLQRRKLNKFGRAAIYTMNKVYEDIQMNIVFASEYGDVERVEKLIDQRKEDGEVSPAGFSASVHNASVGFFSLLKGINTSYNAISAGEKTVSKGLLESILSKNSLFCYTESLGGLKSVSLLICENKNGNYIFCENSENMPVSDSFEDLISFLEGSTDMFVSELYLMKRRKTLTPTPSPRGRGEVFNEDKKTTDQCLKSPTNTGAEGKK